MTLTLWLRFKSHKITYIYTFCLFFCLLSISIGFFLPFVCLWTFISYARYTQKRRRSLRTDKNKLNFLFKLNRLSKCGETEVAVGKRVKVLVRAGCHRERRIQFNFRFDSVSLNELLRILDAVCIALMWYLLGHLFSTEFLCQCKFSCKFLFRKIWSVNGRLHNCITFLGADRVLAKKLYMVALLFSSNDV